MTLDACTALCWIKKQRNHVVSFLYWMQDSCLLAIQIGSIPASHCVSTVLQSGLMRVSTA